MRHRVLSIVLALVCALGLLVAVHVPSAHAAAAATCSSTYQSVKANSGWQYDYTVYGDIKEEAQVIGVFDSATGSVCRAFGRYQVDIEQYFNQCSYTVWGNFGTDQNIIGPQIKTSSCWYTYTFTSGTLNPSPTRCYYESWMFSSESNDNGAGTSWCW